jgi:hypothetical protein
MGHPVIPVPLRFDGGNGEFVFRSGTTVAYADAAVAPVVEGFCSQVTRRHGRLWTQDDLASFRTSAVDWR